jgi:uncharacterized membrane protein
VKWSENGDKRPEKTDNNRRTWTNSPAYYDGSMSLLGVIHTACAVLGLVHGAAIFLRPKGTRSHARLGWAYAASMAAVNVTALCIYRLTGHFNLFHALAVVILVMVAVGLAQVAGRRRPRRWAWRHYQYMSWSYVGLLAATNNEAFVRLPALVRLTAATTPVLPLLATAGLVAASGVVIFRRQAATLARYDPANLGGSADTH